MAILRNSTTGNILRQKNQNWNIGDGLKFDGINDFVAVPIQNYGTNSLSISGWLKCGNHTGCFFGQGFYAANTAGAISIFIRPNFAMSFAVFTFNSGVNGVSIQTNTNVFQNNILFHFVCVFDAVLRTTSIYINGNLQAVTITNSGTGMSGVVTLTPNNTAGRVQSIGTYDDSRIGLSQYLGDIYDLKVFTKPLTQLEVSEIYLKQNQIVPSTATPSLVANYEFNQKQGFLLNDSTSNALNGNLTNYIVGDVTLGATNKWVDKYGNPITQL